MCEQLHDTIAWHYLLVSLFAGVCGFFLSLKMRLQVVIQDCMDVHSPFVDDAWRIYICRVTLHGLSMLFFFLMGIWYGYCGNLYIPKEIGRLDLTFERCNSVSVWFFWCSFVLLNNGANASGREKNAFGWTLYPPLSSRATGRSTVYIIASLHLLVMSSLLSGLNFIVGLTLVWWESLLEAPIFSSAIAYGSWLILTSLPCTAAGLLMVLSDKSHFTHYFDARDFVNTSDPILFVHLFWFFAHPEVYILVLPTMGYLSRTLAALLHRHVFHKASAMTSLQLIGIMGYFVYGHHMFTMGCSIDTRGFFSVMTMMVALPTSAKMFTWIGGLYGAIVPVHPILLWLLVFIFHFSLGGVTGLMLSVATLDLQLHDTYFVVGHFHLILAIAVVCVCPALWVEYVYYYFAGRCIQLPHTILATLLSLGTVLQFIAYHTTGLCNMPRRMITVADVIVWMPFTFVMELGFGLVVVGMFVWCWVVLVDMFATVQEVEDIQGPFSGMGALLRC